MRVSQAHRLPLPNTFRKHIAHLQQALYAAKPGLPYQGDALAYSLYQQIVQPLLPDLEGKERVIIVPDAELNYLPFEALVSNRASSKGEAPHYLLEAYAISYAYSATLLRNALETRSGSQENSLLAMAPFAKDGPTGITANPTAFRADPFAPLYASRSEVEQLGGTVYLAAKATKERFQQTANAYGIIHLATHAKADNEQPLNSYIAFYPTQADSVAGYCLYAQEIYNMRLSDLKLVILSACETGSGQLVRGEGLMSLARAFAYAGCPNIVTTLWKADDRATADITTRMHRYLKAGEPKDVALQKAKLDYLRTQTDPRKKVPYYWANFVFIGDASPLYSNYTWLWWAGGGLLVLLALGYFGWARRHKLHKHFS